MNNLEIITDPKVELIFDRYPTLVQNKMRFLRQLIIDTAESLDEVNELEETLKWGELSYLSKKGSTIRMDWKEKIPDQYALYFQCTSLLIPTFKAVFNETFKYEGTRAIVFKLSDTIPEIELKECIKAALTYHKVKHLSRLGI